MAEVALAGETVGQALARGARSLPDSETPRLDAELLLASVLDPPAGRERLIIERDRALTPAALERYSALIARRAAHEPVAYILGRRGFRHLELHVDPRVLIPRPETELLVEIALELDPGASLVDVGTGSGAVALACKQERPDLTVWGVDVSEDALAVARTNAAGLRLDVRFQRGDLLEGLAAVDAVLANLPYVEEGARLPPEIACYEPPGALFAGADGLDVIRRLIGSLEQLSWRPALLALEIAPRQADGVASLMRGARLRSVEVRRDLSGRDRVVVGRA